MSRLAIINYEKCQPKKCNFECGLYCPVNMQDKECVLITDIEDIGKKAKISSELCIGCGVCVKKCPFNAINIVNIPKKLNNDFLLHSYGENCFRIYNKPSVKKGYCIGILGANGLGKSTILKILSGNIKIDMSNKVLKKLISGTEIFKYLNDMNKDKISCGYKPQDVLSYSKSSVPVKKILKNINQSYIDDFKLYNLNDRKLKDLSGGEMQRLMIAKICSLKKNTYLFDEPTAFLDIKQRMSIANCILEKINQENYIICIEHDLCVLDYICDYVTCLFGESNCYGIITSLYSSSHGINSYLEGYFKKENIKFRDKPIKFNFDISNKIIYEDKNNFNYNECEINHSDKFFLKIEGGSFRKGEVILLIGENGSGKTSFINMISGKYDYIEKNFKDFTVSHKDQNPYIEFKGNVLQLLEMEINKSLCDNLFVSNVLKPLKIVDLYDNSISSLSGGQMQKLSICLCLGKMSDMFLLDEPSAYIDIDDRLKIANIIKNYSLLYNKTVFLVEHDIIMATSISDKVIVFEGEPGKKCIAKSPQTLKRGINNFFKNINITMRRDEVTNRPRINKLNSNKDQEQKKNGQYFI